MDKVVELMIGDLVLCFSFFKILNFFRVFFFWEWVVVGNGVGWVDMVLVCDREGFGVFLF